MLCRAVVSVCRAVTAKQSTSNECGISAAVCCCGRCLGRTICCSPSMLAEAKREVLWPPSDGVTGASGGHNGWTGRSAEPVTSLLAEYRGGSAQPMQATLVSLSSHVGMKVAGLRPYGMAPARRLSDKRAALSFQFWYGCYLSSRGSSDRHRAGWIEPTVAIVTAGIEHSHRRQQSATGLPWWNRSIGTASRRCGGMCNT